MNKYLQNNALYGPHIRKRPSLNLGLVIVIPCYNEPFLLLTLMSLKKCELPDCDTEVIIVINDSETASQQVIDSNSTTYEQARKWAGENSTTRLRFFVLYKEELPQKHAGVGLARKIGMDEACYRLEKVKNRKGIIVGFDADSRCEKNYLRAIENHFRAHPKSPAASIHYEHPVLGIDFDDKVYEAIIAYELHLRYYVHAQRYAGFPMAVQTLGSSMAVCCDAYQRQGGMNRRKAGEDFYFLHKFTPLGGYSQITTTTVCPSPRISDRVPFGTGKAVGELVAGKANHETYHPQSFEDLKLFFHMVPSFLKREETSIAIDLKTLPESIQTFLTDQQFLEKLTEIKSNTRHSSAFVNRFYRWFNAFMVMKYVHHTRDHFYPNTGVREAALWLLKMKNPDLSEQVDELALLELFRALDRKDVAVLS